MQNPRKFLIIGLALLAFAGSVTLWLLALRSSGDPPQHATVLPVPRMLPEFELHDHTGAPFNRESLRDRWSLVFFGFTHCPDICPATLQQLAVARSRLAASRAGQRTALPQIVLISVDPERDTTAKLGAYVGHFGADVVGVTGSLDELRKLTSALGIWFDKSELDGGDYTVEHSAVVLVIDTEAQLQGLFSAPHSIDAFVQDLPRIMAAG